jgi:hypothetical protein
MVVLLALAGQATHAWAQDQEERPSVGGRVRAADPRAAALLKLGLARSPTFRAIAGAIERSDVLVYVQAQPMPIPGALQFAAAASGCRHLRVTVRIPGKDADVVAWLGHELQHALEVAGAPEVVDQASLLRFYARTGQVSLKNATAETGEAQQVWARILREMRYGR